MSLPVSNTPALAEVQLAGNTSTTAPPTSGNPTDTTSRLSSPESSWCGSIYDKIVSFFTAIFHILTCNCFSQSEQTPPENERGSANREEALEARMEEVRQAGAAALARRPAATQAAEHAVEMRVRLADEEAQIALEDLLHNSNLNPEAEPYVPGAPFQGVNDQLPEAQLPHNLQAQVGQVPDAGVVATQVPYARVVVARDVLTNYAVTLRNNAEDAARALEDLLNNSNLNPEAETYVPGAPFQGVNDQLSEAQLPPGLLDD